MALCLFFSMTNMTNLKGAHFCQVVDSRMDDEGEIFYASRICLSFKKHWSIHLNQYEEQRGCDPGCGICGRACGIADGSGVLDQIIRYKKDTDKITFIFDRQHLSNPDAKEIFKDGKMIVCEKFFINSNLCALLGLGQAEKSVPAGSYDITLLNDGTFKVKVPVQ